MLYDIYKFHFQLYECDWEPYFLRKLVTISHRDNYYYHTQLLNLNLLLSQFTSE